MSNAHVTNISSLEQLQQEEPNFNTVDWDNLNRMKYMRGRMVPDCWHMGSIDMSSELWNQGKKYEWIKYAFENYCPPLKKTTWGKFLEDRQNKSFNDFIGLPERC